ncbi:MAG: DUF4911 domain-containing protein [Aquificae bacterium]|nr:DUF4911 domain-containing protein [Aquificota bacterium]
MGVRETLKVLKEKYPVPTRETHCVKVHLKVENVGLFDAIVEYSGRCCLPSTEGAKRGEVTLIVSPFMLDYTLKLLERIKRSAVPELEVKEVKKGCLSFYKSKT